MPSCCSQFVTPHLAETREWSDSIDSGRYVLNESVKAGKKGDSCQICSAYTTYIGSSTLWNTLRFSYVPR